MPSVTVVSLIEKLHQRHMFDYNIFGYKEPKNSSEAIFEILGNNCRRFKFLYSFRVFYLILSKWVLHEYFFASVFICLGGIGIGID